MICSFCQGIAHPATGHQYSKTCIACGPCYRGFLKFYKGRLSNPIAKAALRPAGTLIEGEWTAEDQAKRDEKRRKRRK